MLGDLARTASSSFQVIRFIIHRCYLSLVVDQTSVVVYAPKNTHKTVFEGHWHQLVDHLRWQRCFLLNHLAIATSETSSQYLSVFNSHRRTMNVMLLPFHRFDVLHLIRCPCSGPSLSSPHSLLLLGPQRDRSRPWTCQCLLALLRSYS